MEIGKDNDGMRYNDHVKAMHCALNEGSKLRECTVEELNDVLDHCSFPEAVILIEDKDGVLHHVDVDTGLYGRADEKLQYQYDDPFDDDENVKPIVLISVGTRDADPSICTFCGDRRREVGRYCNECHEARERYLSRIEEHPDVKRFKSIVGSSLKTIPFRVLCMYWECFTRTPGAEKDVW